MIGKSVKEIRKKLNTEDGVALLIVLWVITLLMVLVMSFSMLSRTEANSTVFFRDGVQKKFFAEAALERATMEIFHRQTHKNQTVVLEGNEVLRIDGRAYDGSIGTGRYVFRLFNESGKINLNTMGGRSGVGNRSGVDTSSGIILNNLLVNLGIAKETADIIVDSILDWIDDDDLHRLNGAESDYYQSLPNPYKAKNARLDTLEELLLIKGMSPDILFGTKERQGLIHFVTIYSTGRRIDINAAPKEVLMSLPGMTEDVVNRIIEQRESVEFKSAQDIQAISGVNYPAIARLVDMNESNIYTIESVGFQREEKKGYGIRAIVSIESGGTPRFVNYKSPAEIRE
jgi:general secretion pathway protein K